MAETPFLGAINAFGGNFAINGWALCQGALLAIQQNTALFAILGTTYGGNGQTTFQLPDLRGRSAIGWGQGPGLSNYDIGQVSGTENVTLNQSQMPQHTHIFNGSTSTLKAGGAQPHASQNVPQAGSVLGHSVDIAPTPTSAPAIYCPSGTATPVTLGGLNVAGTNAVAGNSLPFSILNPSLAVTYLIALVGVFPSRN